MKNGNKPSRYLYVLFVLLSLAIILSCKLSDAHPVNLTLTNLPRTLVALSTQRSSLQITSAASTRSPGRPVENRSIKILLDDFGPQPYQGESVYFFNRLEGDRGAINDSNVEWGNGQMTMKVAPGKSWGGVWMSLNHPIREGQSINLSAILPEQILPAYQGRITSITVVIARGTPSRTFRLELKNGNELRWESESALSGGPQTINYELPPLANINQLVWVLDHASAGDYVALTSVSFTANIQFTDAPTAAFVWSYGMLLNNWNPTTGLVRDKAKDASGEFDAIQATGSLRSRAQVPHSVHCD